MATNSSLAVKEKLGYSFEEMKCVCSHIKNEGEEALAI